MPVDGKTLEDWLASSSDDDDDITDQTQLPRRDTAVGSDRPPGGSYASVVSAGIPAAPRMESPLPASPLGVSSNFTPDRRTAQEELREKMKKVLGEAMVAKSVEVAAASVASPNTGVGASFIATNTAVSTSNNSVHGSSSERAAMMGRGSQQTHMTSSSVPQSTLPPAGFETVEVMLVDRGTQTVSTVEVQTDPLPFQPDPMMWRHHHPFGAPGGLPGTAAATGVFPVKDTSLYGNAPGVDYLSHNAMARANIGIDGRPYRYLMDDLEAQYSAGANHLRAQLSVLQNNIDMLISRYNLPPPPGY